MEKMKKYHPLLIMLFVLSFCLINIGIAGADEVSSDEDSLRLVWQVKGKKNKDVVRDWGSITYTDEGLLINNFRKNLSWSYSHPLPKTGKNFLRWHAILKIQDVTGAPYPGIALQNGNIGFGFRISRNLSKGAFSLVSSGETSRTIDVFDLPEFDYPCTIGLRYSVKTHELEALLNNVVVKKVTLPYYGIPALASIGKLAILTENPLHSSIGSVLYGDLALRAQ